MKLQPGEKNLSKESQAELYRSVVMRQSRQLSEHYLKMCQETNNTWPDMKADCLEAATTEIVHVYEGGDNGKGS